MLDFGLSFWFASRSGQLPAAGTAAGELAACGVLITERHKSIVCYARSTLQRETDQSQAHYNTSHPIFSFLHSHYLLNRFFSMTGESSTLHTVAVALKHWKHLPRLVLRSRSSEAAATTLRKRILPLSTQKFKRDDLKLNSILRAVDNHHATQTPTSSTTSLRLKFELELTQRRSEYPTAMG